MEDVRKTALCYQNTVLFGNIRSPIKYRRLNGSLTTAQMKDV